MDCMDGMDGAKRGFGLPLPPQEGDTQSDDELGSGRPVSGRPSPVIARYEAIRGGARRAGKSEDLGRPSPEGATAHKQAA